MKPRKVFLDKLIAFKDKPLIKVITGIRRCGKSTLLDLFEEYLLGLGVDSEHIIRMNFESLVFDEIKTYKELNEAIMKKVADKQNYYILLDEVQQIEAWERAVNSFMVTIHCDIYITGSNAYLLSSELSTLLSGRYVEIKMLPLSFKEYLNFNNVDADIVEGTMMLETYFVKYLEYGGLPAVMLLNEDTNLVKDFLSGIINTVIVKDVIQRGGVRDAVLLENVIRYLADNIGNPVSTKKISDYLTSAGKKTSIDTVDSYIKMLEDAFILYKARRYDIKGKLYLKTLEKYYIVDTGIRSELLGYRGGDYGHILENVVYMELRRRGYDIAVGKVGTLEVDFVATRPEEKLYIQVSATIVNDITRNRELLPLRSINDYYKKLILTMDRIPIRDFDGIECKNIIDFLME